MMWTAVQQALPAVSFIHYHKVDLQIVLLKA